MSHSHGHGHRHGAETAGRPGYGQHGHGDSHYAHTSQPSGFRPLLFATLLTAGYAVVEVIGGIASGSLALLADAGHMATDSAALLFALAANVVARRPVSDRHSFGLARAEVIAAFVNALALLAVTGWIFYEAIDRLRHPVQVQGETVFLIATIGLAINILTAWVLSRDRHNVNTRAAFLHVLGDALGSVAAIASGVIILYTGFMPVDPLLSMFVAALILRSTIGVLKETTLVLLDSVPAGVDYQAVGKALAAVPGVVTVHDLHVWAMVPGRSALAAHVLVRDIAQWPAILRSARSMLTREFHIDHVTLQPEWLRKDAPVSAIPIRSSGARGAPEA